MGSETDKTENTKAANLDDELYRRYLSGEMAAGDQLMLRYSNQLVMYLNAYLHNPQDAEDLMLDCFAVILVKRPRIQEGNFRAYLFKVARNKANRLWKYRFAHNEFELDETLAALDGLPEKEACTKERNVILEKCMNRIAPQYREALWLIYDMEMNYTQAAQVLGCSVKKIDNLLYHGKKKLRQELEKEGITYADI